MGKMQKILVAYDGSPHSKAALDWAMFLGVAMGAEMDVVKVFEPVVWNYLGENATAEDLAQQYTQMEQADLQMMEDLKVLCQGTCSIKVDVHVLKGHVAATLIDYARKNGFDLIVAGTKGHGLLAEILVGSVTSGLVSVSKVPVLIVKEQREAIALKKIVVAYDGSDYAKAALATAIDIGKSTGAQLVVVKVVDPLDFTLLTNMAESGAASKLGAMLAEQEEAEKRLLSGAKSAAAAQGMEISTELLPTGNIAAEIIRYAGRNNADMIVAGSLGNGILDELLTGSVTRNLISLSKIPVLVEKTKIIK